MSHRSARLSIGSLLIAAICGVIWFDSSCDLPLLSPVLLLILGGMAVHEYQAMNAHRIPGALRVLGVACSAIMMVTPLVIHRMDVAPGIAAVLLLELLGAFLVMALAQLLRSWNGGVEKDALPSMSLAYLGVVGIAVPLTLLSDGLFRFESGVLWAAVIIAGCKLNDIGGYLLGSSLPKERKHALSPGISSGKSWEGAIFGLVLSVAGLLIMRSVIPVVSEAAAIVPFLGFAVLLGVASQLSDLFESAIKRSAGTKDSSRLLPAFGGAFDMMDSFIFGAPVGYLFGALWLVA